MANTQITDYASAAFAASGVRSELSLDEWKGGWMTIVGGLNGKPTAQQFNQVAYILSALLNQAISDLSTTTKTSNDALPKSEFTAKKIIGLLAAYGLMTGCDADKLDGNDATDFAAAEHTHTIDDIASGILPISKGGTEADTAAGALKNLGAMATAGGTFTGTVYFADGTEHYVDTSGNAHFKSLTASGDITGARILNAVYNDYAEFFERGEDTEAGDIIALDTDSQTERYVKATNLSKRIVGVHTDEYAMLIGGNDVEEGEDYFKKNIGAYIPVSLAGRVYTKVIGAIHTGDTIVASETAGVGRALKPCEQPKEGGVLGYAVEGDDRTDMRRLRVRVGCA